MNNKLKNLNPKEIALISGGKTPLGGYKSCLKQVVDSNGNVKARQSLQGGFTNLILFQYYSALTQITSKYKITDSTYCTK